MARKKLLLDTNVVVDFLNQREPEFEQARKLFICGKIGEFSLWISTSQATDLVYILSDGGKKKAVEQTLARLREVRTFVNVYPVSASDIDTMLATSWSDPEDALLVEIALQIHADAIISSDKDLFKIDAIPVLSPTEFFASLEENEGITYAEIPWPPEKQGKG